MEAKNREVRMELQEIQLHPKVQEVMQGTALMLLTVQAQMIRTEKCSAQMARMES